MCIWTTLYDTHNWSFGFCFATAINLLLFLLNKKDNILKAIAEIFYLSEQRFEMFLKKTRLFKNEPHFTDSYQYTTLWIIRFAAIYKYTYGTVENNGGPQTWGGNFVIVYKMARLLRCAFSFLSCNVMLSTELPQCTNDLSSQK